jgi:hypothetical protein
MSATDVLTSGWLHGCSLPSFVREHAAVLAEIPFAVVTMADSSAEVSQMPWASPWTNSAQRSTSSALVVSAASLVAIAVEEEVFYGFDEVWFSVSPHPLWPQPGMLVAPRQLVESPLDPAEASAATHMLLGLGDGYGLNFVALDQTLARRLGLVAV